MSLRYKMLQKTAASGPKPMFHGMCARGSHARVVLGPGSTLTCVDCRRTAPDGEFGRALSVRDRPALPGGDYEPVTPEVWPVAAVPTSRPVRDLASLEDFGDYSKRSRG